MSTGRHPAALFVAVFLALSLSCNATQFDLAAAEEKCFSEDYYKGVLVVGEYSFGDNEVDVQATDPEGTVLYSKIKVKKGKFAFTTIVGGDHQVCFINKGATPVRSSLKLKSGIDAHDYSEVAKKENLKPLEIELRRMEDQVTVIVEEMSYMRKREEAMRDTNESTNARVLWFSIFSVAVLVTLGVWQIYYLKKFFQQKKLI